MTKTPAPRLLLCDCEATMSPDADLLSGATGLTAGAPCGQLCRRDLSIFEQALAEGPVIVACGQEAPTFHELAEEAGASDRLACVDIRDRAGWGDEGDQAGPKMAALLAASQVVVPATPGVSLHSEGVALVYGPAETAMQAAAMLGDQLTLTIMLTDADDTPPPVVREIPIVAGRIVSASGWLGAFGLRIDGFQEAEPAGRGALRFTAPRDGGQTECDLIIDLSGEAALFPAHDKRDGYFRADPRDPAAVARVLLQAVGMVGDFEKPLYIDYDPQLCAHSRSRQDGCDRCLQVCPTSAIEPDGDRVRIDPNICAGCGACAAVCPSAAATYAFPEPGAIYRRMAKGGRRRRPSVAA